MVQLHRRALLGAIFLAATGPLSRSVFAQAPAPTDLLGAQGGLVVYFRHGATTWSGVDQIEWPRERQRLLSPAGEAQARTIGAVFKRHSVPVGEVLASPFARCRDMAEIAFGRVEVHMELLGLLSEEDGQSERGQFSMALLRRSVPQGTNRIIVGHQSNISRTTGVSVPEGGAVIVRPNGSGEFVVLGRLLPPDWEALNRA